MWEELICIWKCHLFLTSHVFLLGYNEQNPAGSARMTGNFAVPDGPTSPGPFPPGLARNEGTIPGIGVAMPLSDTGVMGERKQPHQISMPIGAPPLPPGPHPSLLAANQQHPFQQNPQQFMQQQQQQQSQHHQTPQMAPLPMQPQNLPQLQPPSHFPLLPHPNLPRPPQMPTMNMPSQPGSMPSSGPAMPGPMVCYFATYSLHLFFILKLWSFKSNSQ